MQKNTGNRGGGTTAPYQYHTMQIEDGTNEKEQLIINNIRALFKRDRFYWNITKANLAEKSKAIEKMQKKITALAVISAVIGTVSFVAVARSVRRRAQ